MSDEAASSVQEAAVEEEDFAITLRDIIDFFAFIFTPTKIIRWFGRILCFVLIGHCTKLWMWFSMCVLELEGLPCRDDYRLLTMPYPIELGSLYLWLVPTEDTTIVYSRSFFALDYVHFLCCVQGCTVIVIAYLFITTLRRIVFWFFSKCRTRLRSTLTQVRNHRRVKLHKKD